MDDPPIPPPPSGPPVGGEPGGPVDPVTGVPTETGPASRSAWLWAGGFVALALIVALIVFVLVSGNSSGNSSPTPTATLATPSASATGTASPSASASASASATASPSATPVVTAAPPPTVVPVSNTPAQQAAVLFPASGSACGSGGVYSSCPVTSALITAANQWRTNHNPSSPEPLCRCPVLYATPTFVQDDGQLPPGYQGQTDKAAVVVSLNFPPSGHEQMVVLFARQSNGTWLAFNTYCNSRLNTLDASGATSCIS